MGEKITVSVRQIVELVLRSGSIDNRFGGMDRAVEGTRIHRKLQKAGGEGYKAEVFLSMESVCGNYTLVVTGRADGIITDSSGVMIDEIKTTGVPLEYINKDYNQMHWAQAMCYGYIYGVQNGLDCVSLRLTYYHVDTDEIKRFELSQSIEELKTFYFTMLERYAMWTDFQQDWNKTRNISIKNLDFPFIKYRNGQRRLAESVYRTVRDGGKLFCQAPTGIGKTISSLFPSVKAIGEGEAEKIFYLTAKTITRQVAESACTAMREKGLRIKSVTLTAKDKICFLERRECNPEACDFANGHFDRINDALFDALQNEDDFTREVIEEYARRHKVCPFEFALDLTLWSDCIIADYNYVFDPQVYLRRFFADNTGEYVFLIDEAHNLVDRSREMFSASLKKSDFLQMNKELNKKSRLYKSISRVNSEMASMRKDCGTEHFLKKQELYSDFNDTLLSFTAQCEEWIKDNPHSQQEEKLLTLYFDVLSFLKIADLYDERYVTLVETIGSDVCLRLFCLDPSLLLNEGMKKGKASVLFSATLTPLDYFVSILGGDDDSNRLLLSSPFPRENLCLLISDNINTKYKAREQSLYPVAEQIAQTASGKTGNYIAYFPSYTYMQAVYDVFCEEYPFIRTTIQQSHMDEQEREAFLQQFKAGSTRTLVGFCVLNGIYAEGIDLKGDRLIGSVIVGVGLPQINLEQDIIREYFDRINNNGFAYAYQYPGMNKVMQAAGRVIRDDTDKGVVVLIDERFTSTSYQNLLPGHWRGYKRVKNRYELGRAVESFWKDNCAMETPHS